MQWDYEEVKNKLIRIKEQLNLDRIPTYKEIEAIEGKQMCSYIKRVGLVKFSKDLGIRTSRYKIADERVKKKVVKPKRVSFGTLGINNGVTIDIKIKKKRGYKNILGEVISVNKYFAVVKTQNYNITVSAVDLLDYKIKVVT